MSKIYQATGVTETPTLILTKGVGSFLFCANLNVSELTTERVTIFVEKVGKNLNIVQDMLLRDFLLLATVTEDSIHPLTGFTFGARCALTENGGYIQLLENESIKVKLTGLIALKTYAVFGIEEPIADSEILMYETKVMASSTLTQDFDTVGYDVLVMSSDATLSEISITYDNGAVCKFLPIEIEAEQKSVDAIQIINEDGALAYITTRYQIPLKGVTNLNIRKTAGVDILLNMRIDESDFILYQLPKRR